MADLNAWGDSIAPAQPGASTRAAQPMMPPRTPTPTPDSWWDLLPGTSGFGKPARPGPQSWFDWFSKSYNPTAAQAAAIAGDAAAYHTPSLIEQGARAAGAPLPSYLQPEAYRSYMENARNAAGPAGPVYAAAGYLASPLTYFGVGPISEAVGGVASRLAPEAAQALAARTAAGATTGGLTNAAYSAGAGGSPSDIAKNAAIGIGTGGLISGGVGSIPALQSVSPADISARTAADQAAKEAALNDIRYSSKDVGFSSTNQAGNPREPSLADILATQNAMLQEGHLALKPKSFTPVTQGSQTPNQAGYTPSGGWSATAPDFDVVDTGGGPTYSGLLKKLVAKSQNAIENATPIGGTPGQGQAAVDAAADAATRAQAAQTLERLSSEASISKADVRAQALDEMRKHPIGSPQYEGYRAIASAPERTEVPWWTRAGASALGGAVGEAASAFGLHGAGGLVSGLTSQIPDIYAWARPAGVSPVIQQRYPSMTGYQPSPGSADALSRALQYLTLPWLR